MSARCGEKRLLPFPPNSMFGCRIAGLLWGMIVSSPLGGDAKAPNKNVDTWVREIVQ